MIEEPTSSKKIAVISPLMTLLRFTHLMLRSIPLTGRARIGSPSRHRWRSSANASALP